MRVGFLVALLATACSGSGGDPPPQLPSWLRGVTQWEGRIYYEGGEPEGIPESIVLGETPDGTYVMQAFDGTYEPFTIDPVTLSWTCSNEATRGGGLRWTEVEGWCEENPTPNARVLFRKAYPGGWSEPWGRFFGTLKPR